MVIVYFYISTLSIVMTESVSFHYVPTGTDFDA